MFPYIHKYFFLIGPVKIYFWGLFVSLGFLVSLLYLVKKYPEQKSIFVDIAFYSLLGSVVGARIFYVLFYAGSSFDIRDFFSIWQGGLSSFGGFFGATLAIFLYIKKKKIAFYNITNEIAFILPLGMAIGRLGCYFINDHPGIKTDLWFLAVKYPDGFRFDLGLLLVFLNLFIFIFFIINHKHYLGYLLLFYGLGRFGLDFLRINEPSYYGLIPSQYGSILLVLLALLVLKLNKEYNIS